MESCKSYTEMLQLLKLPVKPARPDFNPDAKKNALEAELFRRLPVYEEIIAACNAVTKTIIAEYLTSRYALGPPSQESVRTHYTFWQQTPPLTAAITIPRDIVVECREILRKNLGWTVFVQYYDSSCYEEDKENNLPTDTHLVVEFE